MSTFATITEEELVAIPSPFQEPRVAYNELEPRKVDNLTLIDGKTFSATSVAGDIYPPGSPDVAGDWAWAAVSAPSAANTVSKGVRVIGAPLDRHNCVGGTQTQGLFPPRSGTRLQLGFGGTATLVKRCSNGSIKQEVVPS